MAEYRLYCLDRNGRIARRHDIMAEDDARAVTDARTAAPGVSCELWSGSRKVAHLPADGEPILFRPAV